MPEMPARQRFEIADDAVTALEEARDLLGDLPLWPVTPERLVYLYEAKRYAEQAAGAARGYRDFLAAEIERAKAPEDEEATDG